MDYYLLYFSPTFTTKKVSQMIAETVAKTWTELDITNYGGCGELPNEGRPIGSQPDGLPGSQPLGQPGTPGDTQIDAEPDTQPDSQLGGRPNGQPGDQLPNRPDTQPSLTFGADDVLIIGIPVHSGRVPPLALRTIKTLRGNATPAILLATFGNRHYDDALLELKTTLQAQGFVAIAAAAFATEHSIVPKYGAGRPNAADIREIHEFAKQAGKKLATWEQASHVDLQVEGNPDYRPFQSISMSPHANSHCIKCRTCAKSCPAQAIPLKNPKTRDKKACITCLRCISVCPEKARSLHSYEKLVAQLSLAKQCQGEKPNALFL
ncbi:MAG: hypothetical protein FWF30_02425 [Coriobacteriia bacterium]|nr:hypothetical protein [Coriobacteriia bacterium]